MAVSTFFYFLCVASSPLLFASAANEPRQEYATRLGEILGRNVNTLVPPLISRTDHGGRVPVFISFSVHRVIGLDDKSETLTVSGYLRLAWNDSRLAWTGTPSSLVLKSTSVWMPLMSLSTSADFNLTPTDVRLRASGEISVDYTIRVDVSCNLDLRLFPRDVQNCPLVFYPKEIHTDIVRPVSFKGEPIKNYGGEEWNVIRVVDMIATYKFSDRTRDIDRQTDAYFVYVVMIRKDSFYCFTILLPTFLLAILTLVPYLLPPNLSPQKILIPITTFLSFNIYLTLLEKTLPRSSNVPVLAQVYAVLLASCVITEFFQAVSVKLYSCNLKIIPLPLVFIYYRILGPLSAVNVCHGARPANEPSIEVEGDENKMKISTAKKRWVLMGRINDRCGFIISFIMVAASLLYFIIVCYATDSVSEKLNFDAK